MRLTSIEGLHSAAMRNLGVWTEVVMKWALTLVEWHLMKCGVRGIHAIIGVPEGFGRKVDYGSRSISKDVPKSHVAVESSSGVHMGGPLP
jgi:hypothetical protein